MIDKVDDHYYVTDTFCIVKINSHFFPKVIGEIATVAPKLIGVSSGESFGCTPGSVYEKFNEITSCEKSEAQVTRWEYVGDVHKWRLFVTSKGILPMNLKYFEIFTDGYISFELSHWEYHNTRCFVVSYMHDPIAVITAGTVNFERLDVPTEIVNVSQIANVG